MSKPREEGTSVTRSIPSFGRNLHTSNTFVKVHGRCTVLTRAVNLRFRVKHTSNNLLLYNFHFTHRTGNIRCYITYEKLADIERSKAHRTTDFRFCKTSRCAVFATSEVILQSGCSERGSSLLYLVKSLSYTNVDATSQLSKCIGDSSNILGTTLTTPGYTWNGYRGFVYTGSHTLPR